MRRERRNRKLLILWGCYAAIIAILIRFAAWAGDWSLPFSFDRGEWVFSSVLLVILPGIFILRLFLQMNRLILAGVENWRKIIKQGMPMGKFDPQPIPDSEWYYNPVYRKIWGGDDN